MRRPRLLLISLVLGIGVRNTYGATVYSQAPTNPAVLYGGGQLADNFTLSQTATIVQVNWWGTPVPSSNAFSIRFFTDNGAGAPGVNPFQTFSFTNVVPMPTAFVGLNGGPPIFQYSVILPTPQQFPISSKYYISILSGASGWAWASSNFPGAHWDRNVDGTNWTSNPLNPRDLAFQLATVPEPGAIQLLLVGMIGVLGFYWRRHTP